MRGTLGIVQTDPSSTVKWYTTLKKTSFILETDAPQKTVKTGCNGFQKSSESSYMQQKPWSLPFPGAFVLLLISLYPSLLSCVPGPEPTNTYYSKSGVHSEGWERVTVLPGHAHSHSEAVMPSAGVNGAKKCTGFLAGPVSPYVPW